MIASLVVTGFIAAQPLIWQAEGRAKAERDIATDAMRWKIGGYMAGLTERDKAFTRLMRERFGVTVEVIGQCVMESKDVERAAGYNQRIAEELELRFGPDALKQVNADSKRWQEQPIGWYGTRILLAVISGLLLRRLVRRVRN